MDSHFCFYHPCHTFADPLVVQTAINFICAHIQFLGIHLNGYIEALTPSALNSEFKLSSSSYLDDSFASNEWVRMLKSDIDAASAVILIGISGNSDLDIRRLIYNDGQYQDKIIFIDISKRLHDARLKFGSIETIGLHGLSERIRRLAFVPPYSVFCSISFRCGGLSIERNQKPLAPEITLAVTHHDRQKQVEMKRSSRVNPHEIRLFSGCPYAVVKQGTKKFTKK